jgi:hypothetical protein
MGKNGEKQEVSGFLRQQLIRPWQSSFPSNASYELILKP